MAFPTTDTTTSPVTGRLAVTLNTTITAAHRSLAVVATQAGTVSITFSDNSTGQYPCSIGLNTFPFLIKQVTAWTGTGTLEIWL